MITDGEKWHYLAIKSLSALFRGITGNINGDFHCLNCFHLYTTENKLKKHKKYVKIMIIDVQKCLNPFIIYADLESLLEKKLIILKNHQQLK